MDFASRDSVWDGEASARHIILGNRRKPMLLASSAGIAKTDWVSCKNAKQQFFCPKKPQQWIGMV